MRCMPVLLFLYSRVVCSPRSSDGFREAGRGLDRRQLIGAVGLKANVPQWLGCRAAQIERIDLTRHQLSVSEICRQPAVLDDHFATQDGHDRPSLDLPSLPRTIVAHVEVLARQLLLDRRVDQYDIRVTASGDDTLPR